MPIGKARAVHPRLVNNKWLLVSRQVHAFGIGTQAQIVRGQDTTSASEEHTDNQVSHERELKSQLHVKVSHHSDRWPDFNALFAAKDPGVL